MSLEQSVSQHYTHGNLEAALLDALKRAGKDLDALTYADLAVVDEFHIGGRPATRALGEQIDLPAGARVLDIGCGIGGPARFFAAERGWKVEGIDLTAEYVEVAQGAVAAGRHGGQAYRSGRRAPPPCPSPTASFDGAYMLHVGMNIADKKAVFTEVRRVLKPGGVFAIYDAMRESDGAFAYPVPWSSEPATNHIDTPEAYKAALAAAGFDGRQGAQSPRLRASVDAAAHRAGRPADRPAGGDGRHRRQKLANMRAMIERGVFAPIEIIARAA